MDAISNASNWLVSLLSGTLPTIIAILAVAFLGLRMLHGHLPVRRALTSVVGIFLLFGAPALARTFLNMVPRNQIAPGVVVDPVLPVQAPPKAIVDDDPYAGAALRR